MKYIYFLFFKEICNIYSPPNCNDHFKYVLKIHCDFNFRTSKYKYYMYLNITITRITWKWRAVNDN